MDSVDVKIIFGEFSNKCIENFKVNLRDLCVTKSVMNPTEFLKRMQQNLQSQMDMNLLATLESDFIAQYAELFKVMDTCPSNLQPVPRKRDIQRANSVTPRGNDATQDQTMLNTSNASLTLSMPTVEEQRKAAEVYKDFKKFQRKLGQIHAEEDALDKAQTACLIRFTHLQSSVQKLQKLMPYKRKVPEAFTVSETKNLLTIAQNLKQLNFIRSNSLSQLANPNNITVRLEILVDVLTYTLFAISCFTA